MQSLLVPVEDHTQEIDEDGAVVEWARNGMNDINELLVQDPSNCTDPRYLTMHEQTSEVTRIAAMRVPPAARGRGRGGGRGFGEGM